MIKRRLCGASLPSEEYLPAQVCVHRSVRETLNLHPKVADSGAASVVTVHLQSGLTVSIVTNACEDTLTRCRLVVFFPPSTLLPRGKHSFLPSQLKSSMQQPRERSFTTSSHLSLPMFILICACLENQKQTCWVFNKVQKSISVPRQAK